MIIFELLGDYINQLDFDLLEELESEISSIKEDITFLYEAIQKEMKTREEEDKEIDNTWEI